MNADRLSPAFFALASKMYKTRRGTVMFTRSIESSSNAGSMVTTAHTQPAYSGSTRRSSMRLGLGMVWPASSATSIRQFDRLSGSFHCVVDALVRCREASRQIRHDDAPGAVGSRGFDGGGVSHVIRRSTNGASRSRPQLGLYQDLPHPSFRQSKDPLSPGDRRFQARPATLPENTFIPPQARLAKPEKAQDRQDHHDHPDQPEDIVHRRLARFLLLPSHRPAARSPDGTMRSSPVLRYASMGAWFPAASGAATWPGRNRRRARLADPPATRTLL